MGLSADRVKDLVIAGLVHDIGKAAGEDAQRVVEVASARLHGSISVEEASVRLYSRRERIKQGETIGDFVRRTFKSTLEQERILSAIKEGLRLKETDEIRTFYNLHGYFSAGFLFDKVSDRIRKIVALHHILEGVNPLDENMMGVELKYSEYDGYDVNASVKRQIDKARAEGIWEDVKLLIIADKFDAYLRRGIFVTFDQALGFFHRYNVRHNNFVQDSEFDGPSKVLSAMMREGNEGLRELGIIKD